MIDQCKIIFAEILENAKPLPKYLPSRYFDCEICFEYYLCGLQHAKDLGYTHGLDFGCGNCTGLILGKLLGMEIEGLDIINTRKYSPPPFKKLQESAASRGYTVHWCDTDIDLPFENNSFEFILCWDSFFTDWKNHLDWKDYSIWQCLRRMTKINRILMPGGALYVGGSGAMGPDIDYVKKLQLHVTNNAEKLKLNNPFSLRVYDWKRYKITEIEEANMKKGVLELSQYFLSRFVEGGELLDIGGGRNPITANFLNKCDQITVVDFKEVRHPRDKIVSIQTDFVEYATEDRFNSIWCSHTLEHAMNPTMFLKHMIQLSKLETVFGIIVPIHKDNLVGGHINLFTPGTLCYNIILAGQDLSSASVIFWQNNIAVFWRHKAMTLPRLRHDRGDLELLSRNFPRVNIEGESIPITQGINGVAGWERINADDFDDFVQHEFKAWYRNPSN